MVDDEPAVRELLVSCLEVEYICRSAASAEDALEELASQSFDLVMTDISMPGISGLEFCKRLQTSHPALAVVVISALSEALYRQSAIAHGADDFIQKPFDVERLLDVVHRALQARGMRLNPQSNQ